MKKGAQPRRTCIGCGKVSERLDMIRIVFREDQGLVADPRRREPGRGGYLHRNSECARRFAARGGMVRSFGAPVARARREAFVGRWFANGEGGR